jgi:pimeloyl-ACP methyl ester carboxylesterase
VVFGNPAVTTWILLRGLTRERRHWGEFPQLLQAALPRSTVTAIDLPGAGSLHGMRSPSRIEDIASHCRRQALALGLQAPFNILAMSLGAMVAVAWADAQPQEVASCVLINTSLRPYSPFHRRLRPDQYSTLLRLFLPGSAQSREAAIFRLTSTRTTGKSQTIDDWVAIRRDHPVSAANALRQLLAAVRYRAPARRPNARMLILASLGDALVHPDCSKQLARIWRTDYVEHPGAGHDLTLDDGRWVAERVAAWHCLPGTDSSRP